MENKTVEMVVKDLLLGDNRKKKEEEECYRVTPAYASKTKFFQSFMIC